MKIRWKLLEELSVSLYKRLLVLYPADLRNDYGHQMIQLFSDSCCDAQHRSGIFGLMRVWLSTMQDIVSTRFLERRRTMQDQMSHKHLARQSLLPIALFCTVLLLGIVFSSPALSGKSHEPGDTMGKTLQLSAQSSCVVHIPATIANTQLTKTSVGFQQVTIGLIRSIQQSHLPPIYEQEARVSLRSCP
jgi:hypothetical protein